MTTPRFSRTESAFLIAVPLAWAVLLVFHGTPDDNDIYGSLRDEATGFIVVHLGSIAFIALMGVALYLLLRGVPGRPQSSSSTRRRSGPPGCSASRPPSS